jgi:hypothetical protein
MEGTRYTSALVKTSNEISDMRVMDSVATKGRHGARPCTVDQIHSIDALRKLGTRPNWIEKTTTMLDRIFDKSTGSDFESFGPHGLRDTAATNAPGRARTDQPK